MRRDNRSNWYRLSVVLASVSLGLGLLIAVPSGLAQPPAKIAPAPDVREKQTVLLGVLRSIEQVEQELQTKQEELRSPQAEGRQEELTRQIKTIGDKLRLLRENLNEVASGVDLEDFAGKPEDMPLDWQKEILNLLRPVFNELTRLTARPRELERLRTDIARYQGQSRLAEKALGNLEALILLQPTPDLHPHLLRLQRDWEARRQDSRTQLSIVSQQLDQKLSEQQPFSESVKNLFQLFFRSRGRNFLLACLAFVGFWLVCHRLQGWLQRVQLRRRQGRTFSVRLFTVAFTFFKAFGATLSFLLVLYLFEDWVLLTLAALFLLGIAWTSKQTLPRFMRETMLLLNLGAVREGERVVYRGVPWRVQSLNFYTRLVNPELTGGSIGLPLRDFLDLRSRPFEPGEPWFPTRTDDWVLLGGQTLGKVVLQTPEVVRLILLGGSRRTFSTPDFLAQSPIILSTGFRLAVQFGIDYRHQALSTREIPTKLAARLREELGHDGSAEHLRNLQVEFEEAGASALTLRVLADFAGAAAPNYEMLRRAIQRICVEACNDYGWVIPFTQLTLHLATAEGNVLPEPDGAPQEAL